MILIVECLGRRLAGQILRQRDPDPSLDMGMEDTKGVQWKPQPRQQIGSKNCECCHVSIFPT